MEQSWRDVSVNLSENIPQQQRQWRKIPLYIYWKCQAMCSTSYLKPSRYPWMKALMHEKFFSNGLICCSSITGSLDMCLFKVTKNIIWGQNLYFWVSKRAFRLIIFQYLKNHLPKIVHWPYYGIIIESF